MVQQKSEPVSWQAGSDRVSQVSFYGLKAAILGLGALSWLPLVNGAVWWLALFAHFRLQYLCLQLMLSPLLLWQKGWQRWRWLGLAVLCLLPNLWALLPYWRPHPKPAGPPIGQLSLLHLNLFAGNQELPRVTQLIQQRQPQLIVLMEYTEPLRLALESQGSLAAYPYRFTGQAHLGIYSKLPLLQPRLIYVGPEKVANFAQFQAQLKLADQAIDLLAAHPQLPLGQHFEHQRLHFAHWQRSLSTLKRPLLLVGDLNTTPWSAPFRQLIQTTPLYDSQLGQGIQATWPVFYAPWGQQQFWGLLKALRIPIDHVLLSPEWQVITRQVGPAVGSDHLPVWLELALHAPPQAGPTSGEKTHDNNP